MNKVDILLGLQWGDEGKGKIVDVLTSKYNIVARFQGGPNAGHTIEFDGKHVVLRSVPSGVFNENSVNIIGNGVVFDPILFQKEIFDLTEYIPLNLLKRRILLSRTCHVILPFHKIQDKLNEYKKGDTKIGTTGKGIGPTYTDKAARTGIRLGELIDSITEDCFGESIYEKIEVILKNLLSSSGLDINELFQDNYEDCDYRSLIDKELKEFKDSILWIKNTFKVIDTAYYINSALYDNKILAEGAQGTMLDIDHGTYPYVTSSNTTSGGVCTGLGIGPNKVGEVYGIFKAYCTRVGEGPFPTEDFGDDGKKIRDIGHEYGAVTGRERRCGWLDLVELRKACMLNGVTQLIMTKADVLSEFDEIKFCTTYRNNKTGETTVQMPDDLTDWEPDYNVLPGWKGVDLSTISKFEDLPETFKQFIKNIEVITKTSITIVSVGPDRLQTIFR